MSTMADNITCNNVKITQCIGCIHSKAGSICTVYGKKPEQYYRAIFNTSCPSKSNRQIRG